MAKKEYVYRGFKLDQLQQMGMDEFIDLLPSREKRSMKRGLSHPQKKLLERLESKDKVKTHAREMIILPNMVGKVISVHNGKDFVDVHVQADMIAMRLGQLVFTRKRLAHSNPGVGASRSSAHVSVR